MKSLAVFVTLAAMTSPALAKSGLPALDSITGMFNSVGSHGSWIALAVIAFVIYIAGSAHRA